MTVVDRIGNKEERDGDIPVVIPVETFVHLESCVGPSVKHRDHQTELKMNDRIFSETVVENHASLSDVALKLRRAVPTINLQLFIVRAHLMLRA